MLGDLRSCTWHNWGEFQLQAPLIKVSNLFVGMVMMMVEVGVEVGMEVELTLRMEKAISYSMLEKRVKRGAWALLLQEQKTCEARSLQLMQC